MLDARRCVAAHVVDGLAHGHPLCVADWCNSSSGSMAQSLSHGDGDMKWTIKPTPCKCKEVWCRRDAQVLSAGHAWYEVLGRLCMTWALHDVLGSQCDNINTINREPQL